MEGSGQQMNVGSLVGEEVQAGGGRRGSNASLSLGPGVFAEPSHIRSRNGQPAPITSVHVPKRTAATDEEGGENDEEQRKSASREVGSPVPGGRNEGCPDGSLCDLFVPPKNGAGEGNG